MIKAVLIIVFLSLCFFVEVAFGFGHAICGVILATITSIYCHKRIRDNRKCFLRSIIFSTFAYLVLDTVLSGGVSLILLAPDVYSICGFLLALLCMCMSWLLVHVFWGEALRRKGLQYSTKAQGRSVCNENGAEDVNPDQSNGCILIYRSYALLVLGIVVTLTILFSHTDSIDSTAMLFVVWGVIPYVAMAVSVACNRKNTASRTMLFVMVVILVGCSSFVYFSAFCLSTSSTGALVIVTFPGLQNLFVLIATVIAVIVNQVARKKGRIQNVVSPPERCENNPDNL